MEVLSPSPPHSPAVKRYGAGGRAQDETLQFLLRRASPGYRDPGGDSAKLYVAVGRSPEKSLGLLRWAFRRFGCREIGLLHVHQPSPLIPTPLGRIPVNQANEELVSSFRRIEREDTKRILLSYLRFCHKAQVHASVVVTETDQIPNGIVDIVTQHGIRKLVMGSTSVNCFKLKGSSSKALFTAKNVPPFCEIWFVSKGRHLWTREASEFMDHFLPVFRSDEAAYRDRFWLNQHNHDDELLLTSELAQDSFLGADLLGISSLDQNKSNHLAVVSTIDSSLMCTTDLCSTREPFPTIDSPFDTEFPNRINSEDAVEQNVLNQFKDVMLETERSKTIAFSELTKRKQLEAEAAEAVNRPQTYDLDECLCNSFKMDQDNLPLISSKGKANYPVEVISYEAAIVCEIKIREELEDSLTRIKLQREELVNQRDQDLRELQDTMETIDILDSHAREMTLLRNETAGELEFIQSSIETLKTGKQKINKPEENKKQFENGAGDHASSLNVSQFNVYSDGGYACAEFTLSDLQTATCEFSESFKLGEGGYGYLYKGEIMNKTVMIKKLHQHSVQGQVEFQQEVLVLEKISHPHLVTLIGICPEALSLVFEYMPNGTIQDCLFSRTTTIPMTWRIRARVAAEISSTLLFLHTCKPKTIIHGDLKPENIFLDYNYSCKLGNFGLCQLTDNETEHNSHSCRYIVPRGAFPYSDPELQMNEDFTTKSDVCSFGIIMLQLLTGKPASGLAREVRRAFLSGNLSSVVDQSATWPDDVSRRFAEIGLRCIELNSRDQQAMTPELVKELEQLYLMEESSVPSCFLCPILQEIMRDPQVAADGFTYEARAFREWLSCGRDTSPMTNLKLKHLNLTPNIALRFAIQEWFCQH